MKRLLKQLELERRIEAGLTKEDSEWIDKFEKLMKKAPDGINQRVEAFIIGDASSATTTFMPKGVSDTYGDDSFGDWGATLKSEGIYSCEITTPIGIVSTGG